MLAAMLVRKTRDLRIPVEYGEKASEKNGGTKGTSVNNLSLQTTSQNPGFLARASVRKFQIQFQRN